jgi:DNA mismatch endonuclease (patch repair protein)
MTDVFDKAKRSEVMSRIKAKNTKAELIAFKYLRKQGVYFQKHYSKVVGNPDIALPRKQRAVFIDSDFWHGRTYNKVLEKHSPDSYWVNKIARNIERDRYVREALVEKGWEVLVIWEEDIKRKRTQVETLEDILKFLTS